MRICTICNLGLDETAFGKNSKGTGGLMSSCKTCHNAYNSRYSSKYSEYSRRYRQRNPIARKESITKWEAGNPAMTRAKVNRRRKRLRAAQPIWYETSKVAKVYLKAQEYGMEVDHIIPLSHPLVCGLHCWDNLQLLCSMENKMKSNKLKNDQVS